MNQILFVGAGDKKEIKGIVRFFCVVTLIFGLALAAEGTYNLIKPALNKKVAITNELPKADIIRINNTVKILVSHNNPIDTILYSWNQGTQVRVNGNGRNNIEEIIELPEGDNELKVSIKDINGNEAAYSKRFGGTVEEDTTKPHIKVEDEPGYVAVKITVTDNVALKSIKYKWNNEEFVEIPVEESNSKKVEKTIQILLGDNTLTIVAIDKNGNEEILEKPIKTTIRPKLELIQNGNILIMKATDEKELLKVTYILNGERITLKTDYITNIIEYAETLIPGENNIIVIVYNKDGAIEIVERTFMGT